MTKQATMTTMKRMMVLLVAMMAALVALSTLAAPDAEAKKKKKLPFNVVKCDFNPCEGTDGIDYLLGSRKDFGPTGLAMRGFESIDIYDRQARRWPEGRLHRQWHQQRLLRGFRE